MVRDIKSNRKSFYSNKMKTRENAGHLWKEMGDLVAQHMEKAEVLNDFLTSVFTSKCSSYSFLLLSKGKGTDKGMN